MIAHAFSHCETGRRPFTMVDWKIYTRKIGIFDKGFADQVDGKLFSDKNVQCGVMLSRWKICTSNHYGWRIMADLLRELALYIVDFISSYCIEPTTKCQQCP